MATTEERLASLQWAAGLRGASSPEEAFDWMEQRGLIVVDEWGSFVLTGLGIEKADELYETLQRVTPSRRGRRRVVYVLVALAAVAAWARRS